MNGSTEHNGWTNRETWLVNLWLTNEEYNYDLVAHIVQAFDTISEQAGELEHWIRASFETREKEASPWKDLLGAAIDRVDWRQIAENNQA